MAPFQATRSRVKSDDNVARNTDSLPIDDSTLPAKYLSAFQTAVRNILSTSVAKKTFGQIIAGIPLAESAFDTNQGTSCPTHPLLDEHISLSAEVIKKARQLRTTFDAILLKADRKVIHAFRTSSPGSGVFDQCLIELAAIAIHQLAVYVFQMDTDLNLSKEKRLASWRPPDSLVSYSYPKPYPATLLRHPWYCYYNDYPNGTADGVAYWAEGRIFGGVVLFDRRNPNKVANADPTAVYLHSDLSRVTYRIYRLLDEQRRDLVQFLLSEPKIMEEDNEDEEELTKRCPLPLRGTMANRQRIDPEEPIVDTGIYRDLWERRPLSEDDHDQRLRDVTSSTDYVSLQDWGESARRAWKRRDAIEYGTAPEAKP